MELGSGGFLDPEKILQKLDIAKPGMAIADFGCGAGYFSIPLARMVRPGGEVFAIDILDTAIQSVKSRAMSDGLFNVIVARGDLESPKGSQLKNESQDVVLISNTLFQARNKENIIKEAKRVLKRAGKLLVVDWLPNTPIGPPENLKVSKDRAKQLVLEEGFKFEEELPVDELHYGLLFAK